MKYNIFKQHIDENPQLIKDFDLNSWFYYSKLLSLSEMIYMEIYGKPKTHIEVAESFNKIGKINRIIINYIYGEIQRQG